MRLSNRPTRGTDLTPEEKRSGDALKPHWWGGIRFVKAPSYGKSGKAGNSGARDRAGRSDWHGGSNIQRRRK